MTDLARFKYLQGIVQLREGAAARAFTPWGYNLEFDAVFVHLSTQCCDDALGWEQESLSFCCGGCRKLLALPQSTLHDTVGVSEFKPWLENLLSDRFDPLEALLVAAAADDELQTAREHLHLY